MEQAFDEAASDLERLSQDHAGEMNKMEQALAGATSEEEQNQMREEARRHAQAIRDAVRSLPAVGMGSDSWTSKGAAARELAEQTAQSLEQGRPEEASQSGRSAMGSLDDAKRLLQSGGAFEDPSGQGEQRVDDARRKLESESRWMAEELKQLRRRAAERARDQLEHGGDEEGQLADRARELGQKGRDKGSLPQQAIESIEDAERAARQAADALEAGRRRQGPGAPARSAARPRGRARAAPGRRRRRRLAAVRRRRGQALAAPATSTSRTTTRAPRSSGGASFVGSGSPRAGRCATPCSATRRACSDDGAHGSRQVGAARAARVALVLAAWRRSRSARPLRRKRRGTPRTVPPGSSPGSTTTSPAACWRRPTRTTRASLLERARLAIYELDCDGAAAILARPEVQHAEGGEELADIAHGCQRVTAALAVDRDEARGIEVRWQDEHDRALAPLLFDTVVAARDALTRDLDVDWPKPTRVVVVRDLLSLSAMTGLPYESAQTTGTVAVAKWGRVTLLSPRASHHGYPWRDTVAHELTHLAVTRASRDRAPLWLQEGVAKREEIRWREPGPFDDRPPPEAVVQRGMELGLGVPLDKLGPSIAMLPSADAAMIAFAEVTSFVRFYADSQPDSGPGGALATLFGELRDGKDPDLALLAASGADLKAWDARWRAYLATRPPVALPALLGLGGAHQPPREIDALRDLRDRSRLAQLLMARGHAPEALQELDRIELARAPVSNEGWDRAMGDPSIRWLRGRALEEVGRRQEAEPLMADPIAGSLLVWSMVGDAGPLGPREGRRRRGVVVVRRSRGGRSLRSRRGVRDPRAARARACVRARARVERPVVRCGARGRRASV